MKKNSIVEGVLVEKLIFWWKWLGILNSENKDIDWKKLIITGGAIPGSIVDLRVVKKRSWYYETQIVNIQKKSDIEVPHPNNPYGDCAGAKWANIPYKEQLKIKAAQVEESFFYLRKLQKEIDIREIVASPKIDGYRNKVEFSFGKYISAKEDREEHFNVWFHKQWQFSKIEDFDGCILIDEIQNDIFKDIKDYCKTLWLPAYDQMKQNWFFRHIVIRRSFFWDEIMLILSFNHEYLDSKEHLSWKLEDIKRFFWQLASKYQNIRSIYFSHNKSKADTSIGELEHIYWEKVIREELLWIQFEISPTSFFQTNSYGAEILYSQVLQLADAENFSKQTILDLYWWTGTIGMVFAKWGAKEVISVELVESASKDGQKNASHNNLANISFVNAKVEDFLDTYLEKNKKADLLIIDPPRAWMHPKALPNILKFSTEQIIYVSCNPSTLARDLDFILQNSSYKIETVIPVDMFPHTHHIEIIVSLKNIS